MQKNLKLLNHNQASFQTSNQNFLQYIESLPQKLHRTSTNQLYAVQNKYSSLVHTMKPIKQLISKYKKQLSQLMFVLQVDNRIQQLSTQKSYFQKEVSLLQKTYIQLNKQVEDRKKIYQDILQKVKNSRKELNIIKMQNLSLKLKIQENKRNQNLNKSFNEKKYKYKQPKNDFINQQQQQKDQLQTLFHDNSKLQNQLYTRVQQKLALNDFIFQLFEDTRKTLRKNQKIVHNQGLVGSLIFKLKCKDSKIQIPRKRKYESKMGQQLRFLVYDSLKAKYQSHKKSLQIKNSEYQVGFQKFVRFNQMQTIGFMELKQKSFQQLQQKIKDRKKQIINLVNYQLSI